MMCDCYLKGCLVLGLAWLSLVVPITLAIF